MALEDALRSLAVDLGGRLGDAFVDTAKGHASRRTGEMADATDHDEPLDSGSSVSCRAYNDSDHGVYQDEGTGVYGPAGQRIQGSPLLAFDWPAAGGLVIVHSVAGSPPSRWWQRTLDAWPSIVASVG